MPAIQTITDPASGASAQIVPSCGFNCFSFKPIVNGQPLEVLWSAPGFAAACDRPSHSGIPILFPFAGRVRGQELVYQGKRYPLTLAPADQGHAIHGFVLNRPWRITASGGTHLTGTFQASIDDPALLGQWPADFAISATYSISASQLTLALAIHNPSQTPLPFGLGTHPYVRVPLGSDDPGQCRVDVPATQRWVLDNSIPTGATTPLPDDQRLNDAPFGDLQLDDVLGPLIPSPDGAHRVRVSDPKAGIDVVQAFDPAFRYVVAYIPPHRQAISLEPQLSVPNPFELERHGVEAGLHVLRPDETFAAKITIGVNDGRS